MFLKPISKVWTMFLMPISKVWTMFLKPISKAWNIYGVSSEGINGDNLVNWWQWNSGVLVEEKRNTNNLQQKFIRSKWWCWWWLWSANVLIFSIFLVLLKREIVRGIYYYSLSVWKFGQHSKEKLKFSTSNWWVWCGWCLVVLAD